MVCLRVLIVDDSLTIRAVLTELIGRERDLELVGVAASAAEAIELASRTFPDVITIDVSMPGVNGIDLLDRLPNNGRMKSIMLSGNVPSMWDAMDRGADAFFDKGAILRDPKSFLKLIRQVAAGRIPKAATERPGGTW